MSLRECPDCSQKISDQASACPHCGRTVKPVLIEQTAKSIKRLSIWAGFMGLGGLLLIIGGGTAPR